MCRGKIESGGDVVCLQNRNCAIKAHNELKNKEELPSGTIIVKKTETSGYVLLTLDENLVEPGLLEWLQQHPKKTKDDWHAVFERIKNMEPPVSFGEFQARQVARTTAILYVNTPFTSKSKKEVTIEPSDVPIF